MLSLIVNGKRYKVIFSRYQERNTECRVVEMEGELEAAVVMYGISMCNPLDSFNKEKGRKLSMSRALASQPKEIRALFWQCYFLTKLGENKKPSPVDDTDDQFISLYVTEEEAEYMNYAEKWNIATARNTEAALNLMESILCP